MFSILLMLWVRISIRARCTTLCDNVCQWLPTGRWFSPGPPVSSTNKTDITEILKYCWKLNTIKQITNNILLEWYKEHTRFFTSDFKTALNKIVFSLCIHFTICYEMFIGRSGFGTYMILTPPPFIVVPAPSTESESCTCLLWLSKSMIFRMDLQLLWSVWYFLCFILRNKMSIPVIINGRHTGNHHDCLFDRYAIDIDIR